MCAKPDGIGSNADRQVDMQAKFAEATARYAMVYVVELGVPVPEKVVALRGRNDVIRGPQDSAMKERKN